MIVRIWEWILSSPRGGGGGGVTLHMTGYAPIKKKHIARVCRGGGGGGVLTPNVGNITTGEGQLETLGYVIRSQILIQYHYLVVTITSS